MTRKDGKNSRKRLWLLIAIIVINGFIGFHLIVNYADFKIDILNPSVTYPITDHTKSFYYDYPPNPNFVPSIIIGENGTEGLPLFSLTITYSYNDTLAQDVPFLLYVSGSIYPEGQQTIDRVDVGYQGTDWGDNSFRNYPPTFTAKLYNADVYSMQIPPKGTIQMLVLKWDSEGDYYPYIHIVYKNGTSPTDVVIQQDGKVHVYGLDVIHQEEFNRKQDDYNRRIAAMALDGILFPLIDISTIGGLIWSGKVEQNNKTNRSNHKPNKSNRYNEIKRQKSKSRKKQKNKRNTTDNYST